MLEKELERKCTTIARMAGYYEIRILKSTRKGVPDHIFAKDNHTFFVEFKTSIGVLSSSQRYEIKQIEKKGLNIYVIRDLEEFKRLLR